MASEVGTQSGYAYVSAFRQWSAVVSSVMNLRAQLAQLHAVSEVHPAALWRLQGPVEGCCELGNEPSGSTGSAPCSE
jgi:hypothetical protein